MWNDGLHLYRLRARPPRVRVGAAPIDDGSDVEAYLPVDIERELCGEWPATGRAERLELALKSLQHPSLRATQLPPS